MVAEVVDARPGGGGGVPALALYWQGSEADGRVRERHEGRDGRCDLKGSGRANLTPDYGTDSVNYTGLEETAW
jgi:hypothetical protein